MYLTCCQPGVGNMSASKCVNVACNLFRCSQTSVVGPGGTSGKSLFPQLSTARFYHLHQSALLDFV